MSQDDRTYCTPFFKHKNEHSLGLPDKGTTVVYHNVSHTCTSDKGQNVAGNIRKRVCTQSPRPHLFKGCIQCNSIQWMGHYPECKIYFASNVVQGLHVHMYVHTLLTCRCA